MIDHDLNVSPLERKPGPPERLPGMTVGVVEVLADAAHGGENHPDDDEILYVFQGRLEITMESDLDRPIELGAGDACIVPRGEWHRVHMIGPARLLHVTPGPNGDHRPLS